MSVHDDDHSRNLDREDTAPEAVAARVYHTRLTDVDHVFLVAAAVVAEHHYHLREGSGADARFYYRVVLP